MKEGDKSGASDCFQRHSVLHILSSVITSTSTLFATSVLQPNTAPVRSRSGFDVSEFSQPVATMVLIFNLEEDAREPGFHNPSSGFPGIKLPLHVAGLHHGVPPKGAISEERPNPNINGFSQLLSCYP
jgi:hypothetical protein